MSWNYRIIRTKYKVDNIEVETYAIHEVYYEKDKPVSWSENPTYLGAESVDELRKDLVYIRQAFKEPILEIKNNKLKEIT